MKVPFIDLAPQYRLLKPQIRQAVTKVLDSQQFILKEGVAELESSVAEDLEVRHAIGVASGSDALYLSLWALGIGPGDEVITTPFTFFATAGAIARVGAKPVFADVDAKTFNLDPAAWESKITPQTKAVIPVHLFGLCCDMDAILTLAKKRGLAVIEDAAQAYGASCKGRQAGSMGDLACLSFYPTKNLGGAGDGGMILTPSDSLAHRIKLLRDNGSRIKYHHEIIGTNSRLDEMQAAVLSVKLKFIHRWNRMRNQVAGRYAKGLAGLPLKTPHVPKGYEHVYHLYSILTESRDELAEYLAGNGIGAGVYYPLPLHLQPCFSDLGYQEGSLPVAEELSRSVLSLPMYPELSQKAQDVVIAAIRKFFGKSA
jgi:hypothetical protein